MKKEYYPPNLFLYVQEHIKDFLGINDEGAGNAVVIVKTKKMTSQRKVAGMFAISSPGLFLTKKGMVVSAVCNAPPPFIRNFDCGPLN